MRQIRFTADQKRAVALARSNNGELIRFGNGAWAKPGYKWRGRYCRGVAKNESVYALVRHGVMHLGGFEKGRPTIASLVDYRKRRRGL